MADPTAPIPRRSEPESILPPIHIYFRDGTPAEVGSVLRLSDEIKVTVNRPADQLEFPPTAAKISDQGWSIIGSALEHYEKNRRRSSRKHHGDAKFMQGVWDLFKDTRLKVGYARREAVVRWDDIKPDREEAGGR